MFPVQIQMSLLEIARLYLRWPFREYILLLLIIGAAKVFVDCNHESNFSNQVLREVICGPSAEAGWIFS